MYELNLKFNQFERKAQLNDRELELSSCSYVICDFLKKIDEFNYLTYGADIDVLLKPSNTIVLNNGHKLDIDRSFFNKSDVITSSWLTNFYNIDNKEDFMDKAIILADFIQAFIKKVRELISDLKYDSLIVYITRDI